MEEYQLWRETQGLGRAVTKYPKRSRPIFISDQAWEGLQKIAEQQKLFHGSQPSVSAVIERIGLQEILVYSASDDTEVSYVDVDGLTVQQCFDLGIADYKQKRPMSFSTSALAGGRARSRIFFDAYARGYSSAFIDFELERELTQFEEAIESFNQ